MNVIKVLDRVVKNPQETELKTHSLLNAFL